MTGLVTDDGGELRFVLDAQQEPRSYMHHAIGIHARIEAGRPHGIDADVPAVGSRYPAGDFSDVGVKWRETHAVARGPDPTLDFFDLQPDAGFVAFGVGLVRRRQVGQAVSGGIAAVFAAFFGLTGRLLPLLEPLLVEPQVITRAADG